MQLLRSLLLLRFSSHLPHLSQVTRFFPACLFWLPLAVATAAEYQAELPTAAYHLGGQSSETGRPYNDTQFRSAGLGLGVRTGPGAAYGGLKVGTYENSCFNRSNYLVGDLGHRFDCCNVGVMAGLVSGYRSKFGAAPYVEAYLSKDLSANLSYIQTTITHGRSAIGLSFGWHF